MDTITGNKLIVEFMGLATSFDVYFDPIKKFHFEIHEAEYHSSWDWLMPVVEKIEGIKNSDDYEVDIFGNCCDIGGRFESVGKTKIEAV